MKRHRTYKKWLDDDIIAWAEIFTSGERITLLEMEEMLEISHSTIWWCFVRRLQYINETLYNKVMVEIADHKAARGKLGTNHK